MYVPVYAIVDLFIKILKSMKSLKYFITAFSIVFIMLTSCEKELDFNGSEDPIEAISISVVASQDTTLVAMIAHTYPFSDSEVAKYDDRLHHNPLQSEYGTNYLFQTSAVLKTATVSYSVNGSSPRPMTYDSDTYCFCSDYQPKLGDVIQVFASDSNYPSASAKFSMPAENNSSVEIVESRKYEQDQTLDLLETNDYLDSSGCDTIVDVTLRLKGIDLSKHYRLVIRSMIEKEVDGQMVWDTNECFHSADPIFKDIRLTKPRKGWYSNFSNVFAGTDVNAEEYKCVVTTRLRRGDVGKRIVDVELQTISEELYRYLKSAMLYQVYIQYPIGEQSETVQIFSNIDGGYGIAGALVRSPRQRMVF